MIRFSSLLKGSSLALSYATLELCADVRSDLCNGKEKLFLSQTPNDVNGLKTLILGTSRNSMVQERISCLRLLDPNILFAHASLQRLFPILEGFQRFVDVAPGPSANL